MRNVARDDLERINWLSSMPFFGFHALAVAGLFVGMDGRSLLLSAVLYFVRMSFITAGYHRYFAHRSFKTGRTMRLLLGLGGTTAVQKGPLWWAAHHRKHHLYADTDRDPHSPQRGFWWSHVGWILCDKYKGVDYSDIRDLARYPELRFVDRHHWIGPSILFAICVLVSGYPGVLVSFFLSTVVLWHATFAVNSIAHLFGRRRYETNDTSRNSLLVALATNGEGWHNNHHHYPTSARQGFFWWEIDISYYLLRALAAAGLVHDVRTPPERILAPTATVAHRPLSLRGSVR
jgi:stearoyl-CoA desaturase (delta-9 desaturase)